MYSALNSDLSDPDVVIKLDVSNALNVLCRRLTLDVLSKIQQSPVYIEAEAEEEEEVAEVEEAEAEEAEEHQILLSIL